MSHVSDKTTERHGVDPSTDTVWVVPLYMLWLFVTIVIVSGILSVYNNVNVNVNVNQKFLAWL